jgi:hypothetical protein
LPVLEGGVDGLAERLPGTPRSSIATAKRKAVLMLNSRTPLLASRAPIPNMRKEDFMSVKTAANPMTAPTWIIIVSAVSGRPHIQSASHATRMAALPSDLLKGDDDCVANQAEYEAGMLGFQMEDIAIVVFKAKVSAVHGSKSEAVSALRLDTFNLGRLSHSVKFPIALSMEAPVPQMPTPPTLKGYDCPL